MPFRHLNCLLAILGLAASLAFADATPAQGAGSATPADGLANPALAAGTGSNGAPSSGADIARAPARRAPTTLHERVDTLAASPYWHLLLRYEPDGRGVASEALSAAFFLSPDGAHDPAAELHALLDALHADAGSDDLAAACRFPVRSAWLQAELGFSAPAQTCPQLREWKRLVNAHEATLVFAADYLNSPSSMFGHTFLRLDAPGQTEDTRLLAYAVNYAANTGQANPLAFAWKGLTGGYPGVFSLMPYYDKVKEYSDMENRDLWEYQLALQPAEVDRLVEHLWELRDIAFPYYFLTRNCSFQLLSLMEVARPGMDLRSAFPVQAIPTDTVRRVLEEPGLFRQVAYRPSSERRLLQDARDNPAGVNRAALALARDPSHATGLPPREEAAALETAYDYLYHRFMAKDPEPDLRPRLRQLLARRAGVDVADQREAPRRPAVDPANGHPTARAGLAAGSARGAGYVALRLRPAYHDLLDTPAGYRDGGHIDFLDGELRLDEAREELRLERLALIDIDSIAPWDDFFRPWSWFVGFGYRQAAIDRQGRFSDRDSHGVAYVDGGAGASVAAGDRLECFLMVAAAGEAGPRLDRGARAGAGPRAGCRLKGAHARARLQVDSRWQEDMREWESRTTLEGQFDLGKRNGLRLQVGELRGGSRREGTAELGWLHYF